MINKTIIKMKKGIKPHNPILIVGLPGIGNVGKLVAEHLKRELKAKKFATIYSPHFPHQVVMLKNGGVRLVNNRFYLIKLKKQQNDIVLLTGDAQPITPEGQYEVNAKIIEFFKEQLGGQFVYTVGGYNIGNGMRGSNPRVFGNATGKDVISQFKGTNILFGKSKGTIWGSAGLLVAFAKMNNLKGICIMGETAMLEFDASAAKAVIISLSKKLNLDINTADLDKMIERTSKIVSEIEKQMGGINLGQQYQQLGQEGPVGKDTKPSYIR